MVTKRARNLLGFLKDCVEQEEEPIREAKNFLRQVEAHLSDSECLFLNCAVRSKAQLRKFCAAFKV